MGCRGNGERKEVTTENTEGTENRESGYERCWGTNNEAESFAVHHRAVEGIARRRRGAEAARTGRRAETGLYFRRAGSDQSRFEQLFGADDAQGVAQSRAGRGETIRSGSGSGSNNSRHHENTCGAGGADRGFQERG